MLMVGDKILAKRQIRGVKGEPIIGERGYYCQLFKKMKCGDEFFVDKAGVQAVRSAMFQQPNRKCFKTKKAKNDQVRVHRYM